MIRKQVEKANEREGSNARKKTIEQITFLGKSIHETGLNKESKKTDIKLQYRRKK